MAWAPPDRLSKDTCGQAHVVRQGEKKEKAFHPLGPYSRAGTPQTSPRAWGWRKGGVPHCLGALQHPSMVLLHHGPPARARCSVLLAALHWSPPDTGTAALLLVRHPKDGEMGPWASRGPWGSEDEAVGLPRGEKHQRYLCSDPPPVGALLGFTWGSTVRRGMEEALPDTAWS